MNRISTITRRHLIPITLTAFNFMAFGPLGAMAALQGPPGGVPISEEFTTLEALFDFLKTVVQWILVFGLLVAVAAIIWGGIKYVTAGGNSEKAGEGAKIVGYSLLGVAIMVLAYALVNIIASVFGVNNAPNIR